MWIEGEAEVEVGSSLAASHGAVGCGVWVMGFGFGACGCGTCSKIALDSLRFSAVSRDILRNDGALQSKSALASRRLF